MMLPVIPLDKSLIKKRAVLATSSCVMGLLIGDLSSWAFLIWTKPGMLLADREGRGPAEIELNLIWRGPNSDDYCLLIFSNAAFAVPITL